MLARPRLLAAALALLALSLAACGKNDDAQSPAEAASPGGGASTEANAPTEAPAPAPPSAEASGLIAATRDFAESGCAAARRRLDYCSACESAEQKPLRDLLLAYCKERESPSEARTLYEEIITNHPGTFASAAAIMHVRQIDATELPPLTDFGGERPRPADRPQPAYPPLADAARIEGTVRVRFDVRADGSVGNVRVVESTPPLLFDAVALYAVSDWRYEAGHAAEAQQVTLRFDLPDDAPAASAEAAP